MGHERYCVYGKTGPGRKKYHQDDRGSNDGVTKKKAEKEDRRKRRLGGRSGSIRCRRSSARGTQLAAQLLKFIQDVMLKKCGTEPQVQTKAEVVFGTISVDHNGPGRAITGRQTDRTEIT
jgi:hypothetical protein